MGKSVLCHMQLTFCSGLTSFSEMMGASVVMYVIFVLRRLELCVFAGPKEGDFE
jgi:hypothetical protein